jgi:hypothetical protein
MGGDYLRDMRPSPSVAGTPVPRFKQLAGTRRLRAWLPSEQGTEQGTLYIVIVSPELAIA